MGLLGCGVGDGLDLGEYEHVDMSMLVFYFDSRKDRHRRTF